MIFLHFSQHFACGFVRSGVKVIYLPVGNIIIAEEHYMVSEGGGDDTGVTVLSGFIKAPVIVFRNHFAFADPFVQTAYGKRAFIFGIAGSKYCKILLCDLSVLEKLIYTLCLCFCLLFTFEAIKRNKNMAYINGFPMYI